MRGSYGQYCYTFMFVNHTLWFLFLVTCPTNAACFPNGPGSTECLCQAGWFGYKCLVKVRLNVAVIFFMLWFNPRGVLQISSEGNDKSKPQKSLSQKLVPPKNPMPNFWALKFPVSKTIVVALYLQSHTTRICGHYHKSFIKPLRKTLAKFFFPKKSRNQKFQTPKNPAITLVTWNPEYPPPLGF